MSQELLHNENKLMNTDIALKILLPAMVSFLVGLAATPFLNHFLYKFKMWKPKSGKKALDGSNASVFNQLHADTDVGTPRFGGIIVWGSVFITAIIVIVLQHLSPSDTLVFNFVSRGQTWLVLAALAVGALTGMVDDLLEVRGTGGMSLRYRMLIVLVTGFACAWWFYTRLNVSSIALPFSGSLELGWFFIVAFTIITACVYAGGVIDGIDGLSGGIFAIIFSAYAGIAFFQMQYDIAALCATITGGLLAFLWFNIQPARYYLSETGTMAITLALTVVAFSTDTLAGGKGVAVLPLVALPLVVTVASNFLQILCKKFFRRKLFRIAPIHHHFEAIGWPRYKITMRYWIVGVMSAILGMVVALL